jgi:hypothetical protein
VRNKALAVKANHKKTAEKAIKSSKPSRTKSLKITLKTKLINSGNSNQSRKAQKSEWNKYTKVVLLKALKKLHENGFPYFSVQITALTKPKLIAFMKNYRWVLPNFKAAILEVVEENHKLLADLTEKLTAEQKGMLSELDRFSWPKLQAVQAEFNIEVKGISNMDKEEYLLNLVVHPSASLVLANLKYEYIPTDETDVYDKVEKEDNEIEIVEEKGEEDVQVLEQEKVQDTEKPGKEKETKQEENGAEDLQKKDEIV